MCAGHIVMADISDVPDETNEVHGSAHTSGAAVCMLNPPIPLNYGRGLGSI